MTRVYTTIISRVIHIQRFAHAIIFFFKEIERYNTTTRAGALRKATFPRGVSLFGCQGRPADEQLLMLLWDSGPLELAVLRLLYMGAQVCDVYIYMYYTRTCIDIGCRVLNLVNNFGV